MKNYMVIVLDETGEQSAHFFDEFSDAENFRMNAECGIGWYAEIYARVTIDEGFTAYSLI